MADFGYDIQIHKFTHQATIGFLPGNDVIT